MALNEAKIKQIEDKFEETFNDANGLEVGQRFRTDDEATAEDIIDQALQAESFPMDANMNNLNADILIQKGMSEENWAEHNINVHDKEDTKYQSELNNDLYSFISQ